MLLEYLVLILPLVCDQQSEQSPLLRHNQWCPSRSLQISMIKSDNVVTCERSVLAQSIHLPGHKTRLVHTSLVWFDMNSLPESP
jgi:hypothetical protein